MLAPLETPGELAGNPRGGVPSSVTKPGRADPPGAAFFAQPRCDMDLK
ncbi:MAG: hypothetical protein P1U81_03715 [Verrucomicrobiales bacterium]|nr:hypothetical protein [bacterium]MDF2375324.1 hypothetical protein [Verrucomicrobiales bacterium]